MDNHRRLFLSRRIHYALCGTSISHWCCVRISKFFVFPWAFLASRYSFNSKFPIPNEVAICEIPRKLIKCFFVSVIFLCSLPIGILLRCLSKAFSSPHPQKLTNTSTILAGCGRCGHFAYRSLLKNADHKIYEELMRISTKYAC